MNDEARRVAFVDTKIPQYIIGDEPRIRQVLHNLLANAYKFTHCGTISIDMDLVSQTVTSATVKFSVNDSGIGIPEEFQQKIFNAFYQINQYGTPHTHKGVGLGLSISQQLCNSMGSQLLVTSQEGMGAEFHFTITFNMPTQQHMETPSTDTQSSFVALEKKIFVIEDDAINQKVMAYFLDALSCPFASAHSGISAINHLLDNPRHYDVIVLDIGLPDIHGLELLQTINTESTYTNTPIIILTAQVLEQTDSLLQKHPMISSILTKPIDIADIHNAIQKATQPTPSSVT